MTNTQLLRLELLRRIRAEQPTMSVETATELAEQLEKTNAYEHDGERIVPVGSQAVMARAARLAPEVCGKITRDYVAHSTSGSTESSAPRERARARLRALGVDLEHEINGGDDDRLEFMGVDLSSIRLPKGAA